SLNPSRLRNSCGTPPNRKSSIRSVGTSLSKMSGRGRRNDVQPSNAPAFHFAAIQSTRRSTSACSAAASRANPSGDATRSRCAILQRRLIGAEELREKSAEAAADVDEQRGFLRFIEAAARDAVRDRAAIRIESREERRVVTFDESIERARQIGEAFGIVKIV